MCYIVFSVVCLVCSVVVFCVVSQNKEETAECGTGSKFQKLVHTFSKQQFIFAL